MTIPNGFLRLPTKEYKKVRNNRLDYEVDLTRYPSSDFLEMEKPGYELLYVLDPSRSEAKHAMAVKPYPGLTDLLSGNNSDDGILSFGKIRVGRVSQSTLDRSIIDFNRLTEDQLTALAMTNESLSEVLIEELNLTTVKEDYWPFLKRLDRFIRFSVQESYVVLFY